MFELLKYPKHRAQAPVKEENVTQIYRKSLLNCLTQQFTIKLRHYLRSVRCVDLRDQYTYGRVLPCLCLPFESVVVPISQHLTRT